MHLDRLASNLEEIYEKGGGVQEVMSDILFFRMDNTGNTALVCTRENQTCLTVVACVLV